MYYNTFLKRFTKRIKYAKKGTVKMTINDVWGQIRIEDKYERIINSKEFSDMKNKTQLGLNTNFNAIHTRYQHCIGTYLLACKLVGICKNKFSKILNITLEDEQAIKCMALVHDIGHGCFSHVSEKYLTGTHENRTVRLLLDENSDIHKAIVESLGESVLNKTVDLIKMKESIKDNHEINSNNDLMLIIGKLLSGGIDIDRIDYIYRDSKYVNGETNDYSNILESIDLENIDDGLEIVFESSSEFSIANFFNKRFELYDSLYFDNQTRVLENIFGKFLSATDTMITWDTTEIEMNNLFRQFSKDSDPIASRYAALLVNRKLDDDFIIKELPTKESYEYFRSRLLDAVPELDEFPECLFENCSKISIYNKDNKIFINKDGLIQDISECSKILNSELKKEKYVFGIDMILLRKLIKFNHYSDDVVNGILKAVKKATDVEIEQEKKYVFSNKSINPKNEFLEVIEKFGLVKPKFIENIDTYYDEDDILESYRIAVRKRESNGKVEWTVKRPLNDKSSISKREELNFTSYDKVVEYLQNEWKIPVNSLSEKVTLKTSRAKYDLEYFDGLFEFVFDKTVPTLGKRKYDANYMIECELKDGNSAGLYFIDKMIKEFDFIEGCKLSKKEVALDLIRDCNNTLEGNTALSYQEEEPVKPLVIRNGLTKEEYLKIKNIFDSGSEESKYSHTLEKK
ncbi:MAG: HD domain-containing protein [Bacilli bacterium]